MQFNSMPLTLLVLSLPVKEQLHVSKGNTAVYQTAADYNVCLCLKSQILQTNVIKFAKHTVAYRSRWSIIQLNYSGANTTVCVLSYQNDPEGTRLYQEPEV